MSISVSVLLTHHLAENQPYLNFALSGLASQMPEMEVIVLSDAETKPVVPPWAKLIWDRGLTNTYLKNQVGVAAMAPSSRYICLHSDDVVLGRGSLRQMVESSRWKNAIVGPVSNNDVGSRYLTRMTLRRHDGSERELRPDMTLDDVRGFEDALFSHEAPARGGLFLLPQAWICFFCVLFPKCLWQAIGPLDEKLETRGNDVDYCLRAAKAGYSSFIDLGAFAFHFGTKTISKSARPGEQDEASAWFLEKQKMGYY